MVWPWHYDAETPDAAPCKSPLVRFGYPSFVAPPVPPTAAPPISKLKRGRDTACHIDPGGPTQCVSF